MRNVLYLLKRLSVAAAVLILAASCASIPKKAAAESSVQLLPGGADVLIRVNVENNAELIEPVLAMFEGLPKDLSDEFLKRTETIWAGLDFGKGDSVQPFRSSVAALGDYPKSAIEWGLCWDSAWKKKDYNPLPGTNSNLPYWSDSTGGGQQICLPDSQYFLASSGGIEEMLDRWADGALETVDAGWLSSEKTGDVTIMTRNLTPEDYAAFIPEFRKVPIKSLIISLSRGEDSYLISGRFRMDSEVNAFLFATLFRTLVITSKDDNGKKTFASPREIKIEKDGSDVVLDNMRLPAANVAGVEKSWLELAGMNGAGVNK